MTDPPSAAIQDAVRFQQVNTHSEVATISEGARSTSMIQGDLPEEDDGEIACICAYPEDDGNTIQCDKCLRWQHISCYYPPPKEVPGEHQKHYCIDCVPQPDLDARKAADRQRRLLEQRREANIVKRPPTKSHKKKSKDSPALTIQPNAMSDKYTHIHGHDRKSASPREQSALPKKTKTNHRSTNSMGNTSTGRKRAGTITAQASGRSPSPDSSVQSYIPRYSNEFLQLFRSETPQVETDTNLMSSIAITNMMSDWLTKPDTVAKVTGGLTQHDVFQRWDGTMEDIPGRPQVSLQWVEDEIFAADGLVPRWGRLIVEDELISSGTFIGELRGRIAYKDDYINDPDSRWDILHHPEPFVFFHPTLPISIDARQEGSVFRFVRRSCQPNAELRAIITEGTEYHFCFTAKREITRGEEITVAWQVPDTIRDRINSSLATSNNFQANVRDYISSWVSTVLSNCGPCACNGQSSCLMAHYDRRGMIPMPLSVKPIQKKRKVPSLDTTVLDRSRSTSEARKVGKDEDGSESRSASGSHASRDMTPNTAPNTAVLELSEREKKKLMREEEMFKKQEEERRSRKKRNSGGSALATPAVGTSRHQLLSASGQGSRSFDVGSSSNKANGVVKSSGDGRRVRSAKDTSSSNVRNVTCVDSGIQCDMDKQDVDNMRIERPRKRYISVTQRLLERCISNNMRQCHGPSMTRPNQQELAEDTMDMDVDNKTLLNDSSVETRTTDAVLTGVEDLPDTGMDGVEMNAVQDPVTSSSVHDNIEPPPVLGKEDSSNLPWRESPPPLHSDPQTENKIHIDQLPRINPMHIDMPPPSAAMNQNSLISPFTIAAPTANMGGAQSPVFETPSNTNPFLSPAVQSAPPTSPVRKKMSLSDYTKRKARDSSGGNESIPISESINIATGSDQDAIMDDSKSVVKESAVDDSNIDTVTDHQVDHPHGHVNGHSEVQ